MKTIIALLVAAAFHSSAQRVFPLNGIGIDSRDSFEDLTPLGEDIGKSSIVVLQDWSKAEDGASYEAIGRLIHYLHVKKGFDVLIWDLGIFEGILMDEAFRNEDVDTGLKTMYKVWRESEAIQKIASYASASHETSAPLMMAGSSCQFHRYSKDRLIKYLADNREPLGLWKLTAQRKKALAALWSDPIRLKGLPEADLTKLRSEIQHLDIDLPPSSRWLIQNMLWFVKLEGIRTFAADDQVAHMVAEFMELTTSANLEWLFEHALKTRKTILFGGLTLPEKCKEDTFIVGITGYAGEVGRPGLSSRKLLPPGDQSIEKLLAEQGHSYAYLTDPTQLALYETRLPGNLETYDGIVFIKEVHPNNKVH